MNLKQSPNNIAIGCKLTGELIRIQNLGKLEK